MNLKKKIIINSLELFESYGIKVVTMDDIANSMGISKKTLYVHFSGKKDLVKNVVHFLFERHFLAIDKILAENESPIKKINKIYEYAVNYLIQVPPIFHLDLQKYHAEAYRIYDQNRSEIIFGIVKKLLDEGQLKGEIDKSINTAMFCEFHLISLDKIINSKTLSLGYSVKDILHNTIGISLRGIFKK